MIFYICVTSRSREGAKYLELAHNSHNISNIQIFGSDILETISISISHIGEYMNDIALLKIIHITISYQ